MSAKGFFWLKEGDRMNEKTKTSPNSEGKGVLTPREREFLDALGAWKQDSWGNQFPLRLEEELGCSTLNLKWWGEEVLVREKLRDWQKEMGVATQNLEVGDTVFIEGRKKVLSVSLRYCEVLEALLLYLVLSEQR